MPLVLFLAALSVADDALIQVLEKGRIDWSSRIAVARGIGIPVAGNDDQPPASPTAILNAARLDAQTNLLKIVGAIRIDADYTVADRMAQDTAFADGLSALVQNAVITHQEYLSDGTVEIELTMKLSGGFGQFVLPEEIRQVDSITATGPVSENSEEPVKDADSRPYTGLVIDASGIGAVPALVPLVFDESGEIVYGPAFVSREFAVSRGMSGFATTLDAARRDERVGDHPMIVKAIRIRSTERSELVISNADAARLRSSVIYLTFLKACRVIIVLDAGTGS